MICEELDKVCEEPEKNHESSVSSCELFDTICLLKLFPLERL